MSLILCLALAPSAFGADDAPAVASATSPARALPSLIATMPSVPPTPEEQRALERRRLELLRAAGGATAGAGLGLMGYVVFLELAGPIGLAAGLIFFGGMTAYMAHRQLAGQAGRGDLKLVAPAPPETPPPQKPR